MSEQVGIKETKELLVGIFAISTLLMERLKDGWGYDDAIAIVSKLLMDSSFKDKLTKAFSDIDKIKAEVKDLKTEEIAELAAYRVPEIMSLIGNIPSDKMAKLEDAFAKEVKD